ncbi:hypothetical protein C8J56DRAFT_1043520 [Mycena floridula]|nr:hypothetical protein C8J56DRAFT_1043520 [Mycena floridula]
MSAFLLDFSEEILQQIIVYLTDDRDYEYFPYPESLYHHVSSEISAVSLVNHQLRRICFPFLFSYIKCGSLEELHKLESECISKQVGFSMLRPPREYKIMQETLVRLLPRLESIIWLELGLTALNPALVTAIHEHPTLKTASTDLPSLSYRDDDDPLPKFPIKLEKILLRMTDNSQTFLSVVQGRSIRVIRLDIGILDSGSILPSETRLLDLRELYIAEDEDDEEEEVVANEEQTDQFHALVAHHPSLTKICIIPWHWDQCRLIQRHIKPLLDAGKGNSFDLDAAMNIGELALSPIQSASSKTALDGWEVTELELVVTSSMVECLALISQTFPRLLSLKLTLIWSLTIHVGTLLALISKHFLTLRVFDLRMGFESLIWTPLLIPIQLQLSNETFDDVASRMRWLAGELLQASPSMTKIDIETDTLLWYFRASYRVHRDWSGAIVQMKIESSERRTFDEDEDNSDGNILFQD